jgi:hypothetical protein
MSMINWFDAFGSRQGDFRFVRILVRAKDRSDEMSHSRMCWRTSLFARARTPPRDPVESDCDLRFAVCQNNNHPEMSYDGELRRFNLYQYNRPRVATWINFFSFLRNRSYWCLEGVSQHVDDRLFRRFWFETGWFSFCTDLAGCVQTTDPTKCPTKCPIRECADGHHYLLVLVRLRSANSQFARIIINNAWELQKFWKGPTTENF